MKKKTKCDVYVAKRHYSAPGQCESVRGIMRVRVGDTIIRACVAHRAVIAGGGVLDVTEIRR